MTIVEPRLTLQKSGPTRMRPSMPGTFRLNVHNAGLARAFAPTIIDRLPSTATGGTCNAAPTQVTAQVFQADGVTPVAPALIAGTDYTVAFAAGARLHADAEHADVGGVGRTEPTPDRFVRHVARRDTANWTPS